MSRLGTPWWSHSHETWKNFSSWLWGICAQIIREQALPEFCLLLFSSLNIFPSLYKAFFPSILTFYISSANKQTTMLHLLLCSPFYLAWITFPPYNPHGKICIRLRSIRHQQLTSKTYRKEICQTRELKTVEILLKTPVVMSTIRLCYKWVGLAHSFDSC